MKGIDVSENNGDIDWQAVADAGIEFVMVRYSYGKHGQDSRFLEYVNGAHEVGLKVGAYHYGYGLTPEDAIEEAANCKQTISDAGVLLELPVFYDLEDADGYKAAHNCDMSRDNLTGICQAFLNNLGLSGGIYASLSWLENSVDWKSLGCPVWNAQYNYEDNFKGYMWQNTDSLVIAGKNFDGDILYN
ncbi:GH25 family lysozyme [Pectinatus frisingensis]|uniref:GH25 family lysozyme n=1 Tax=Pectinatus frisingensis TaxID=865 RepID=UPI0018C6C725|nr:GH25 family lysozyme [Pectinatus frisingensis]